MTQGSSDARARSVPALPSPAQRVSELAAAAYVPAFVAQAGAKVVEPFAHFFAAELTNVNTRRAYARAILLFERACAAAGVDNLAEARTLHVAAYRERLATDPEFARWLNPKMTESYALPTVKQHLAALNGLYDYLVSRGALDHNPAASVRGPRYSAPLGKTPVLSDDQVLDLLESIPTTTPAGLRDRALISVMIYEWARASAVARLRVRDYQSHGKRWVLSLQEKRGKRHRVEMHHRSEEALDAYLDATGLRGQPDAFLFPTLEAKGTRLSDRPLSRSDLLRMVKRRAQVAGIPSDTCCHTFRATGITNYMARGGRRDVAQERAGHADARTTALYDHSANKVTKAEIERIHFERQQ